ncbi:periplasmic heavy metal sensor [Sphingomonas sp.]|uniref:periplasmic heavy metal sensor n=1 Tax=Sphingomonas sp. TaxID=28214 RepID=UPI003B3BADBC
MKRWPRTLLVVSLVLNVFLAGAIASGIWHWRHHGEERNSWRRHVADALPALQAKAFHQAIKDVLRASKPVIMEGRAGRAEAVRLFGQPNYDAAAVMTQLDRARGADTILRTNIERRVVQFGATLPQDQRQRLAKALEEGPLRQGRRR